MVGPTASGKSSLALALAEHVGGEIVNSDAFQFYRGMDIGTAKPTAQERARANHHMFDVLEIADQMSCAQYQIQARIVVADLVSRATPVIVVGGSGLYVKALLDDLSFPGSNELVRARWEAELDRLGPAALHDELLQRDPQAANRILPSNGRRIVRALEVGEITGEGFRARLPSDGPTFLAHSSIGLTVPRSILDERIEKRTRRMFTEGLLDEVEKLRAKGLSSAPTARRALGYQQALDTLDERITKDEAIESTIAATRRYARRQERWFRRDPRTDWVDGTRSPKDLAVDIKAGILG